MRNFSEKSRRENQYIRHVSNNIFFPKIVPFMRKRKKNSAPPDRSQTTIQHGEKGMRCAYGITKAKLPIHT